MNKYVVIQRNFYWLLLFDLVLMASMGWSYFQEHQQWWYIGAFVLPIVSFIGLLIHRYWGISIRVTYNQAESSSNR